MIPAHDRPGRQTPARGAVAAPPALAATAALPRPRGRAPHRARPGLHGRDPVHGPHLHPLGAAAGRRVRLRQRDHLLAALCRMGPRRGVRAAAGAAAGGVGRGWRAGLGAVRGDQVGANPVDRAKPGSKLHLAVDGSGLPLSLLVTGANTNDSLVFEALLEDLPSVRTPAGQRRRRPDKCHADKAYDHRRCRAYLTRRGIKVRIARRGVESSTRLGRHRWKAERSIAWLAGCRRLRIRYDRDSERFFAFAMLACARLGYNRLPGTAEAHARSP